MSEHPRTESARLHDDSDLIWAELVEAHPSSFDDSEKKGRASILRQAQDQPDGGEVY
jgi:hypothetical protein